MKEKNQQTIVLFRQKGRKKKYQTLPINQDVKNSPQKHASLLTNIRLDFIRNVILPLILPMFDSVFHVFNFKLTV